jgi:hypothetical protein
VDGITPKQPTVLQLLRKLKYKTSKNAVGRKPNSYFELMKKGDSITQQLSAGSSLDKHAVPPTFESALRWTFQYIDRHEDRLLDTLIALDLQIRNREVEKLHLNQQVYEEERQR